MLHAVNTLVTNMCTFVSGAFVLDDVMKALTVQGAEILQRTSGQAENRLQQHGYVTSTCVHDSSQLLHII